MKTYRVTLEVEYEAKDEDEALEMAQAVVKAVAEDEDEFGDLSYVDEITDDEDADEDEDECDSDGGA